MPHPPFVVLLTNEKNCWVQRPIPKSLQNKHAGNAFAHCVGNEDFFGGTCLPGWGLIGSPCEKRKMEVQAGKDELRQGGPLLVTNGVVTLMNGHING